MMAFLRKVIQQISSYYFISIFNSGKWPVGCLWQQNNCVEIEDMEFLVLSEVAFLTLIFVINRSVFTRTIIMQPVNSLQACALTGFYSVFSVLQGEDVFCRSLRL